MREKLAGALGLAGFITIFGATGGLEQGGSVTTYLCITAAGVVMIATAMFWYEWQQVRKERYRKMLEHRRVRRNENGVKRRRDSY